MVLGVSFGPYSLVFIFSTPMSNTGRRNKIKVAVDITPLTSSHKIRGIGSYTENLIAELKSKNWGIDLIYFSRGENVKADLVHFTYFDLFFHTLPIFKRSKTVVTIHDVIPLVFPDHFPRGARGSLNLFLQKLTLKNINAVITDSNNSRNDIEKYLSIDKSKIHVAHLAAAKAFKKIDNKKLISRVTIKYDLPRDFILFVGDLNWNKNILNLLEAVKISKKKIVLVGKSFLNTNLPEAKSVRDKISKLELKNEVIFTGFVKTEELAILYNTAKVTCLPSIYEGFGLPVIESMACATPVICSNNSSLTEVGGNAPIYCDPLNPKDIASKINLIFNLEPEKRVDLEKKSIEQASRFSWQKTAEETVKVYMSALQVK